MCSQNLEETIAWCPIHATNLSEERLGSQEEFAMLGVATLPEFAETEDGTGKTVDLQSFKFCPRGPPRVVIKPPQLNLN